MKWYRITESELSYLKEVLEDVNEDQARLDLEECIRMISGHLNNPAYDDIPETLRKEQQRFRSVSRIGDTLNVVEEDHY